MTKRARRFRKMLMSEGIGRNAANYLVKRKSVTDAVIMAGFTSSPGFVSVTGVSEINCDTGVPGIRRATAFRVKREVKEP